MPLCFSVKESEWSPPYLNYQTLPPVRLNYQTVPPVRYKTAEMWMLHCKRAAHGSCIFKSLIGNKLKVVQSTCLCYTLSEKPINASTDVWGTKSKYNRSWLYSTSSKRGWSNNRSWLFVNSCSIADSTAFVHVFVWRVALKPFDWLQ